MKKFTIKELEEAFKVGDKRMKESHGHRYIHMLKTRCDFCNRSPKQKGQCNYWYKTLYTFAIEELLKKD